MLAAQKIETSDPGTADWYLSCRVSALLDLKRWNEALPQLQKMVIGSEYTRSWIEEGYIGLLRIAAAKSNIRAFKKTWKDAQSANPNIPGASPQYYEILGFGIDNGLSTFVGPVLESLKNNKVYKKTDRDVRLLEKASNYVSLQDD